MGRNLKYVWAGNWGDTLKKRMRSDEKCRLNFYDLQERPIPEVRLSEDFVICTWKVRAALAQFVL